MSHVENEKKPGVGQKEDGLIMIYAPPFFFYYDPFPVRAAGRTVFIITPSCLS